jgi:predicted HicB family RNase H-like nuclease
METKDNYLTYKGYIGTVSYSHEDDILYGKIEGINDSISYHGESIRELKNAFMESVDDYLELCATVGKVPEKSYKGSFNVRVGATLHKRAAKVATMRGITLNQLIQDAIKKEVEFSEN